jgi:hypothetical protein
MWKTLAFLIVLIGLLLLLAKGLRGVPKPLASNRAGRTSPLTPKTRRINDPKGVASRISFGEYAPGGGHKLSTSQTCYRRSRLLAA